jgi:hypothetical protein
MKNIISPAFLPLAFCPVFELFLGSFEPKNVQLHINILDSKKKMKIQNNKHLKKKKTVNAELTIVFTASRTIVSLSVSNTSYMVEPII